MPDVTNREPAGERHRCSRPDVNDVRLRRCKCPDCGRRWRIAYTVDGFVWKPVSSRARVWRGVGEEVASELLWVVAGRILWAVISAPFKLISALLTH
jgi:hypothetical protein